MLMALYLLVKSGDSQGESYLVAPGMILGKKGAQIRLNDPKVSTQHAKIEEGPDGMEIRDLGSKNGILRKGKKVESLMLVPGAEFTIGETLFLVLEIGEKVELPKEVKPKGRPWPQILSSFLRKASLEIENKPVKLEPMYPALVLDFLRGPQTETRWIMGYGPRTVGRTSVDFPILEPLASEACFEIHPSSQGILLKVRGHEVRLNGKVVSSEILKVGDRIQILGSELEVDFLE